MFHASGVRRKGEEEHKLERHAKKKREREGEGNRKRNGEKYEKSLVSRKVTDSTRTLVKGKGSWFTLSKNLFRISLSD